MIRPLAPFVNQNAQETYASPLAERKDGMIYYPRMIDKIFVFRLFPPAVRGAGKIGIND